MEKNYVVYQHVTPDGLYYFGTTSNIKRRWSNNGCQYKTTSLYPYIEKFGWENIQHIVLFKDKTKEDALWIEDFLIQTAREDGVCINKNRSGFVSKKEDYDQQYYETNKERKKQYYETNKEQIQERKKQYYETNKGQVQERQKQYYEINKEQILEQQKQYYEKNKGQVQERHKQYYEQNKDKIQEYQRQYYKRKKQEKQFKELGCLPL